MQPLIQQILTAASSEPRAQRWMQGTWVQVREGWQQARQCLGS